MLEQLARALADRRPELKLGGYPDAMLRNTSLWGDAIAMLKVLRPAAPGMIEAGCRWDGESSAAIPEDARGIWQAMIDKVLEEGE